MNTSGSPPRPRGHVHSVQRVPTHPPEGYTGPWHVVPASGEFWDEAGRLLPTAAARVGRHRVPHARSEVG